MRIIELFAGIGSQIESFKTNNLPVISLGISEIDRLAIEVYEKLHGETVNFGDISKIKELPAADLWTYSFPCQDLSIAGKQKGLNAERSGLLWEVERLLETSEKPKYLLMENVKNLVGVAHIDGFNKWCKKLEEKGYRNYYKVMNASKYGAATKRERIFMVSILDDEKPFIFPPETKYKTVREILLPPTPECFVCASDLKNRPGDKPVKLGELGNGGQGNRIYSIDAPGITLTASGGGKGGKTGLYLRDEGIYKLSGIESLLLMGWKKERLDVLSNYSNNQLAQLSGNSISIDVLSKLMSRVYEHWRAE